MTRIEDCRKGTKRTRADLGCSVPHSVGPTASTRCHTSDRGSRSRIELWNATDACEHPDRRESGERKGERKTHWKEHLDSSLSELSVDVLPSNSRLNDHVSVRLCWTRRTKRKESRRERFHQQRTKTRRDDIELPTNRGSR